MTYLVSLSLSYELSLSRLAKARLAGASFDRFAETVKVAGVLWSRSPKGPDERREACLQVLAAATQHLVDVGVSQFARVRLNDLLVAFDELRSGRHSVLLAPSPVHPGTPSMTDLAQQAMAQVCVDVLRRSGWSAGDARKKTAGLYEKYKLPKFSESKLRTIGSRLTGRGATQDPAYDLYEWACEHAERVQAQLGMGSLNSSRALKLADTLVALTKNRDHRRDFFFAPEEDSSPTR